VSLRVGSLIYATEQGLGILARSLVSHGIITAPMVVRHGRHADHPEWYTGVQEIHDLRSHAARGQIRRHLLSCSAVLFIETPFDWGLLPLLREARVPTALLTMHECTPRTLPALPDLFICPSDLDYSIFTGDGSSGVRTVRLDVPVGVPWRLRGRARTFVHNAGWGSFHDRNGTRALLEAIDLVRSPAHFLIRSQQDLPDRHVPMPAAATVEWRLGTALYETLWDEGDVFVFPERFNGLSLPLREARASGMLVMASDRPNNHWLPTEPLIPVSGYTEVAIGSAYRTVQRATISPADVAVTIDAWYDRDISSYSSQGRGWAMANSWEALGGQWTRTLEDLIAGGVVP